MSPESGVATRGGGLYGWCGGYDVFNESLGFGESSGLGAPEDSSRQQYRAALTEQLRVGLAENRQIDLRDATHHVVVAFADERILPVWHEAASREVPVMHLFVAPTDFDSGQLTMVSLTDGSTELQASDEFVSPDLDFDAFIATLRSASRRDQRISVVAAPNSLYHDATTYSFTLGDLIDV